LLESGKVIQVIFLPVENNNKLNRRWDSERELFKDDIFYHFYAASPGSKRIRWNNAK